MPLAVACLEVARRPSSRHANSQAVGKVKVTLDLKGVLGEGGASRALVFHNGWVALGKKKIASGAWLPAQLYLTVRAEPDPRFVFEFDGEPECSPQVF